MTDLLASRDAEQGVIWGHRFLLQRDPSLVEIDHYRSVAASGWGELQAVYRAHPEYLARFERSGRARGQAFWPLDLRAGLIWGHRLLHSAEPADDRIDAILDRVRTIDDVRRVLIFSPEFERATERWQRDLADLEVLHAFRPFCTAPAPPGFVRDFLGAVTRLDHGLVADPRVPGTVEGAPFSARRGGRSDVASLGVLRSVFEARRRFVMMACGAGGSLWLVSAALAAKRLSLNDVFLIAVEPGEDGAASAHRMFCDNGLDPSLHRFWHGVGGEGISKPEIEVLVREADRIDVMHVDVRDGEEEAIVASLDLLTACVRRIVLATPSRRVEQRWNDLLPAHGWLLERERRCETRDLEDGSVLTVSGGDQVWRNPRF